MKAEYEREVTKLMQGCRSQKLYAEIVREGGAALGVHSMQAIANITGRPIVVQTVDGTESPFPDATPSEGGKVSIFRKKIRGLIMWKSHFRSASRSSSSTSRARTGRRDTLYTRTAR